MQNYMKKYSTIDYKRAYNYYYVVTFIKRTPAETKRMLCDSTTILL